LQQHNDSLDLVHTSSNLPAVMQGGMCDTEKINTEYTGQQFNFFLSPQTSTGELSSTFYADFRYVYRIFLSGRVSKIHRNL